MTDLKSKCKCGLKGVTGDGCKYCNRELYIECLEAELAELKEQLDQSHQEPIGYVHREALIRLPTVPLYDDVQIHHRRFLNSLPLYKEPQLRGLSDSEKKELLQNARWAKPKVCGQEWGSIEDLLLLLNDFEDAMINKVGAE